MPGNPIPIILILFLVKNKGNISPPTFSALELEAFLDNARTVLNTIDKLNSFSSVSQGGALSQLPDMKKVMEIVEKLPL